MGKCWFESLHVDGPDEQAASDYFFTAMFFNGDVSLIKEHPISNYFCNRDLNTASLEYWRYNYQSNQAIFQSGTDEKGNLQIDLVSGVENFKNKVLFITGECNTLIGEEYQKDHMMYFNNTEMVVINNAGHSMFGEQPEESIGAVRRYFKEN
jgi:pimeloyl-ACP methyl ester carboxylesterase